MKTAIATFAAIFFFMAGATSIAAEWKPLQGNYALTPEHYLDPSESEPKDSHYRFQLSGQAAKDLFSAMKVPESKDECTGATSKRVGEMMCLRRLSPERFECSFSINVMTQKIEQGVSC